MGFVDLLAQLTGMQLPAAMPDTVRNSVYNPPSEQDYIRSVQIGSGQMPSWGGDRLALGGHDSDLGQRITLGGGDSLGGDRLTYRQNTPTQRQSKADQLGAQARGDRTPGRQAQAVGQAAQGRIDTGDLANVSLSGLGPSQRDEFLRRAMQLGQAMEQQTGIPAEIFAAMAANESNFGNAPGNIMGGVKADPNDPNAIWLDTWEMRNGQRVQSREPFLASGTPLEGMQRVAQTLQSGRYANAYQALQSGAIDANEFMRQVNAAGYATNPNWAQGEIAPLMREAAQYRQAVTTGPTNQPSQATPTGAPISSGLSQFGQGLSQSDAEAACGPTAAAWFVSHLGRTPTVLEAMQVAKQRGYWAGGQMQGPASELQLLQTLGVQAQLMAPDPRSVATEIQQGRPVIIDTQGHYFQVTAYNPDDGTFRFGDSVGRGRWSTLENLGQFNYGPARTAIVVRQ